MLEEITNASFAKLWDQTGYLDYIVQNSKTTIYCTVTVTFCMQPFSNSEKNDKYILTYHENVKKHFGNRTVGSGFHFKLLQQQKYFNR